MNSKGGVYIKPPDLRPGLNGGARPTVKKREKERQKRHAVAAATVAANDNSNNTIAAEGLLTNQSVLHQSARCPCSQATRVVCL